MSPRKRLLLLALVSALAVIAVYVAVSGPEDTEQSIAPAQASESVSVPLRPSRMDERAPVTTTTTTEAPTTTVAPTTTAPPTTVPVTSPPTTAAPAPALAPAPASSLTEQFWAIARCETGRGGEPEWTYNPATADWGSKIYQGGLQFHPTTWDAYAPVGYPSDAFLASPSQQIHVGTLVLAAQGWGAWPHCSASLGYR